MTFRYITFKSLRYFCVKNINVKKLPHRRFFTIKSANFIFTKTSKFYSLKNIKNFNLQNTLKTWPAFSE